MAQYTCQRSPPPAIAALVPYHVHLGHDRGENAQNADTPMPIEVRGGTASFDVGTNVPALSVHGKSTAVEARGRIKSHRPGAAARADRGRRPGEQLVTGMGLRDEHMRKYVFTTADGQTPDVKFVAKDAACEKTGGKESTCHVNGDLSIRGTARPFSIAMKVTESGDSFRASGDGIVKLSAYGIPQPSQLGVHTDDDVKLRLELTARPAPVATTGSAPMSVPPSSRSPAWSSSRPRPRRPRRCRRWSGSATPTAPRATSRRKGGPLTEYGRGIDRAQSLRAANTTSPKHTGRCCRICAACSRGPG